MAEGFRPRVVKAEADMPKQEDYFDEELKLNGVEEHEAGKPYEGNIDYATFEKYLPFPDLKRIQRVVLACTTYLSLPIVTDTISDHHQRRQWRAAMLGAFGLRAAKFTENRMRINKTTAVVSFANILKNALRDAPQNSPVVAGLLKVTEDILEAPGPMGTLNKRYREMIPIAKEGNDAEADSRYKLVQRVSEAARAFLAYVEHPQKEELPNAA